MGRSLELGEEIGNINHQAQVLYGMAQIVGIREEDATILLQHSLRLNREIGNREGERIVKRALRRYRSG
jgi:hypothetical protein